MAQQLTATGGMFANTVLNNYGMTSKNFQESLRASAAEIRTGHPISSRLGVGEQVTTEMASLFLDLTNFTGRTFWDEPAEVARLAHAVLSGFTTVVTGLGGHVLGLRGDGLFAGFGPSAGPVAAAYAAQAAAASLDGVENYLNPRLRGAGLEPVQARAGADYGSATFVRSGTSETSEVNVIGFTSNFAAKCEKAANSWEFVVGEGFAAQIRDHGLLSQHERSPKSYQRHGERRTYDFFDYKWRRVVPEVDSSITQLRGRSIETIKTN